LLKLHEIAKTKYVTNLFARISGRYDFLNTVMTLGRHYAWRHMAVKMTANNMNDLALDIGTGTGDFAFDLAIRTSASHVVGLDCTKEMLSIAIRKAQRHKLTNQLTFVLADAHTLPFPDNYFASVTVGFGIRNLVDIRKAIREMIRVTKPGGRIVTLEIVRAHNRNILGRLFSICFQIATPWIGSIFARDREAYSYLPKSVQEFLSAAELASIFEEEGLTNVGFRDLALGTVAIHMGEKHP
jgi:demethylmenaquinone methyltransferase/2-methoxy-6-polyprenyl-1,4-benzoquinol methylase